MKTGKLFFSFPHAEREVYVEDRKVILQPVLRALETARPSRFDRLDGHWDVSSNFRGVELPEAISALSVLCALYEAGR